MMVSGPNLNETSIVSGGYGGTAEGIIPTGTIKGRPSRGAGSHGRGWGRGGKAGVACRGQCCSLCDGRGGRERLRRRKEGTAHLAARRPVGKEVCCSSRRAREPSPAGAQPAVVPGGEDLVWVRGQKLCLEP